MGISRIDIHRSLITPDTPPPEVESHNYVSASYTKVHAGQTWNSIVPISPPMSSYDRSFKPDMSAGKNLEGSRQDAVHSAPRQQLPSLSSLFGPPGQMRPLHSPLSDRPSPLRSPLDRPASASAASERTYSNSYFPSVSAAPNQPRGAYESRAEPERISLPSVASRFPGPLSPRIHDGERVHATSRNDSTTSSTRWSSQSSLSEARRPEYVLGTREPATSFRPVNDRLPYNVPHSRKRSHESLVDYREPAPRHPQTPGHGPGSFPVTASEAAPVKDGLGPKIWTGTQFLPRFVRQAEVPGEGLCYFYDDGSHCKTVIDGEQVNAHWGVTKAGKPRKRLAIACLTCREKKIKCDPDFPRCVQCEKFGRVCKFKNAPRGGHNTSPASSPGVPMISQTPDGEYRHPRSPSSTSVSPRTTTLPRPSTENSDGAGKRVRVDYEHYQPATTEAATSYQQHENKRAPLSWHQRELPRIHEDLLCRTWPTDSRHHAPL